MTDVNLTESFNYIDFDSALSRSREEVDRALFSSPALVRGYVKHLTGTKGKFIRAVSLLTCAMNNEGLVNHDAVVFAAAVELLHLATLVHDDVIDDADIRRGVPTLQKMFGKRTAVICGDYLLSVSLKLAASVRSRKDYLDIDVPDYVSRVCTGELSQHINNGNFDLSVYQYLKIIAGKTAALFEASFFAGAVLSGCESAEYKLYKKMGRSLGMLFQLIDDCMDFEADESIAKKPVQSDFGKDVVTLPIIKALQADASLKDKAAQHELSAEELNDAVKKFDGLGFTRLMAKKYHNRYIKTMDRLSLTEEKKVRLTEIVDNAYRVFRPDNTDARPGI
jgi:heptaprenyl diphosphate synthase